MALRTRSFFIGFVALAGACTQAEPNPLDDPECQIQAEGEKSPGYPFDLAVYTEQVLPLLTGSCSAAGCHAAPAGNGGFTVWAEAAPGNCGFAQTFNSLSQFVDLANPENSAVINAINGELPGHPMTFPAGDPNLVTVEGYVQTAADLWEADGGGTTTPPPGASPFDYAVFQAEIQPIVNTAENKGCALAGCHATGAGTFTLTANPAPDSAEMERNFIAITSRMNLTNPASSQFLIQATTRHGAGASAVVSADQAATILAWIEDAKENAGDGGAVGCAPLERFSLGVFRDEIFPILNGDLDLNAPGGGASIGCTRGPCHGQDRGPGVLYMSPNLDDGTNLQNFACFVDLISPSASEILLCPLDDPRCRRSPHPGQDVFSGAEDLNYQRLLAYLYGSKVDSTPHDFAFFVRRVNPIFNDLQAVEQGAQGRTCSDTVACHGVSVAGQSAPNGSNFPIIPNAADLGRLTFNFASAASFVNFVNAEESSLFLYPTNEIANIEDHPFATGLPHPGGEDFAVNSQEALNILRWSGGLRPDNQGFVKDWLVGGDYAASRITDATPIDEINATPQIFDPTGSQQFNAGEWDGLFSEARVVDLNVAFPRDATAGRSAYAVAYIVNTTGLDITAQVEITSPNAVRFYVDNQLVAQSENAGNGVAAIANLAPFSTAKKPTRILIKLFQRATDDDFTFSLQLRDEFGNLLTDQTGELVILLGPQGGI
jgi:hypothetical protein